VKIAKFTAKSQQKNTSNHAPEDHYAVYKTQH